MTPFLSSQTWLRRTSVLWASLVLCGPVPERAVAAYSKTVCAEKFEDDLGTTVTKDFMREVRREGDEATDILIAYLEDLFKRAVIGRRELTVIERSIKRGEITNPISSHNSPFGALFTDSSKQIHFEGIKLILEGRVVRGPRILAWVTETLSRIESAKVERAQFRASTVRVYQKIEFHEVAPATFQMGDWLETSPVTISQSYELMATPVTQWQWFLVMGEIPVQSVQEGEAKDVSYQGKTARLMPDFPVENVSWQDVQVFITRLNQLSLLNDPVLGELFHIVHGGTQFKLPSEAQWEHIVKSGTRPPEDRAAWGQVDGIQPVGIRNRVILDGKTFYDFRGNIHEWVNDWFSVLKVQEARLDPQGPEKGKKRVVRGVDLDSVGQEILRREGFGEEAFMEGLGFRLVTIK